VVAATHADLPALVKQNRFRADLLDRLAFDVVPVPPLRERPEDIPLLAGHFAVRMTRELGREVFAGFAPEAMAILKRHDWPGNVRELRNVVERSVYRADNPARPISTVVLDPFPRLPAAPAAPGAGTAGGTVVPLSPASAAAASTASRIPAAAAADDPAAGPPGDFTARTRAFEHRLLRDALESCRFNQRSAARLLGLTYYQFRNHLKNHGLLTRQTGDGAAGAEDTGDAAPDAA
ncbi:MAG: phage shock protein operon transcriptional activator, partial [Gluconacetobacter diazotrophicus]|nr:phage shock protein operon transcriptional activator [Gluconacetobacter diazotrophicus]